ncbi:MAG: nitroreductase family protein [Zoogloeaceae bacterium]|nr:nitroreductase family protein [Zoogloeaceae bacterium]
MAKRDVLLKILELARWAPSGDNTQPWRFEIVSDDHIAIHGSDTRDWCVYDFDGHASHMAHGALLETLRIAASGFGLRAQWTLRTNSASAAPIYDVILGANAETPEDQLLPFIEQRVVQRRPMSTASLTEAQCASLAAAPGPGFTVEFFQRLSERLAISKLLWRSAYIRLVCPEAYEVHRDIIEWGARFSEDRIPEQAVGVDPLTARLMKWVMGSWTRVEFFNKYLFGTIPPRIQLDFIPGLACGAHVVLKPKHDLKSDLDFVNAGVAMQRLWLTAASHGLHLQPQMTPVIFRWYARANKRFSRVDALGLRANTLADELEALVGAKADDPVAFFCRIGRSNAPVARSTRRPLSALLVDNPVHPA